MKLGAQQHSRGDQADQPAARDHRITDVGKVLQLLHDPNEVVVRNALQLLHVKWYHCGTERLQSLLRVVGAPARTYNLVPQVVQAYQVCRPWERPGQSNTLTYSLALAFQEEVQCELLFYRSLLEPGLGGERVIPIVHVIDCRIRRFACVKAPSRSTVELF